jgi:hypothetical protein
MSEQTPENQDTKRDPSFIKFRVSKATVARAAAACNPAFEAIATEFSKRLGEVADKSSDSDELRQPK